MASGGPNIVLSLDTHDFSVEHVDGKAQVRLSRHLEPAQARSLAAALLRAADDEEAHQRAAEAVFSSTVSLAQCGACDGEGRYFDPAHGSSKHCSMCNGTGRQTVVAGKQA